ncbi:M23 family metallopeptidase [Microlunatus parietis]|uniref:Murein DD-endopeptidase MepM/ murein hydrolase activator NlpD n=1 Tax=Microlunatus parietis TaxID=682979 RepID=A0A7Y9LFK0_9ACTN|nr:peptidoglycan DD-metalloendopeptidase family protein [Microlunatus parietis]NYE74206.1 murein DD-endopeptidase MepM/ murein hydrolase activator NlpD [Microlunatus parietis]
MKIRTCRGWSLPAMVLAGLLLVLAGPGPTSAEVRPGRTGWPLSGPIEVARPFDPPTTRWGAGHRGVDLAAPAGSPVLAAAAGTVTYAQPLAGRGVLVVDHGATRTTYEPVTATVPVGTRVTAGQRIGTLQPGHCPPRDCLHWGWLRGDTYLDPLRLGGAAAAPGGDGRVRLVGEAQREVAERRAAERAAAAAAAAAGLGGTGPPGEHGFVPPVAGPITSPFGMRLHPVLRVTKLHDGTDFGAGCGTPIRAPYPGRVSQVFFNPGYGNRLMIDHGTIAGRHVVSGYNHASSYSASVGQQVAQGQVIGRVGSTGYSTGCHLHLMLWLDGEVVDPMSWW